MIQRLAVEDVAAFGTNPQEISFSFDPVPVGLCWTGNIAFSVALGSGPDLQGIVWTAFRNGTPIITWQEFGVACDVQAIGGEQITVTGVYMGNPSTLPKFEIKATWTGFSDDAPGEPRAPWVAGSNRGLVQVYNTLGPNEPLAVSLEPQPASVQRGRVFVGVASGSGDVMTNSGTETFKIWEVGLAGSCGQLSATAGAQFCTITIRIKGSAEPILQTQLSSVPGSADSTYLELPLHGFELPAGDTLELVTGTYGGDNLAAVGHAVFSVA